MAKNTMTENSKKIFYFLKTQTMNEGLGRKFTTKEVQTALGFENPAFVTGSVGGLCKKGYAERFKETVETEDGKTKEVSYFSLTQAGLDFDPDAVVEED